MTNNQKLKPCPFCGEKVFINKKALWHGSHGYFGCYEYDIRCKKCGCNIRLHGNDTIYNADVIARKNAIKARNRRTNNE